MVLPDPLVFDHLAKFPGLIHGVFSRAGGKSVGPFSGLNLGMNCGDEPVTVAANRSQMLAVLGGPNAVFLNQVHGKDILVIKKGMDIRDIIWNPGTGRTQQPVQADAVVTDIEGLALVILVADCQAVILYDPVNRVVANVHSGWRGSVANILGQCVDTMTRKFRCRPENILAGISPSLGPCCAEFINYRTEIPEPLWKYRLKGRANFDFWKMSRDQLAEKGMKRDHIRFMGKCSKCNEDIFFSYRANRTTGRFGAVVGLIGDE